MGLLFLKSNCNPILCEVSAGTTETPGSREFGAREKEIKHSLSYKAHNKNLNSPLQLAIQTETPTSLYSFIICNRVKLELTAGTTLDMWQLWEGHANDCDSCTVHTLQDSAETYRATELKLQLGEKPDCIWAAFVSQADRFPLRYLTSFLWVCFWGKKPYLLILMFLLQLNPRSSPGWNPELKSGCLFWSPQNVHAHQETCLLHQHLQSFHLWVAHRLLFHVLQLLPRH